MEKCGDNSVNGPEECDDGNTDSGDGCTSVCTSETCGDGFVDIDGVDDTIGNSDDEACDDANEIDTDGCTHLCDLTYCGDDILQQPNGS